MAGVTRDINYKLNFVPGTMGGIAAGISGLNQFVDLSNEFFRGLGGINVIDASLVGLAATLGSIQLQATQAFAVFDEGLASVKAISQELTGNMETISNAANQFSIQFGKDVTEITEGLETLGRAGLTGLDNQLNTLQEGFNLSKIEGMELNSALETLVQTTTLLGGNMNDLDFSSDVQTVNDLLVGTSMAGPLEVSDVAMTLKYAGGTAATAGANLEDTDMLEDLMGTIAVFAQRGVVGDPAGTALRAFLTNPAGQNSTTVEGLEKIGLTPANLWEESGEKMLPISEQIRKINNAMEQLDLTQQEKIEVWSDIVGSKLGQQMLKLNADDIDQATTNIREQASAQEIAEQSLDNLNAKFASLEQAAQSAWREFGEASAKVIGPIIEGLTKILEILSNPVFATGLSMIITSVMTNAIAKGIPLVQRLAARVKDSYNQYSAFYAKEGDTVAGGEYTTSRRIPTRKGFGFESFQDEPDFGEGYYQIKSTEKPGKFDKGVTSGVAYKEKLLDKKRKELDEQQKKITKDNRVLDHYDVDAKDVPKLPIIPRKTSEERTDTVANSAEFYKQQLNNKRLQNELHEKEKEIKDLRKKANVSHSVTIPQMEKYTEQGLLYDKGYVADNFRRLYGSSNRLSPDFYPDKMWMNYGAGVGDYIHAALTKDAEYLKVNREGIKSSIREGLFPQKALDLINNTMKEAEKELDRALYQLLDEPEDMQNIVKDKDTTTQTSDKATQTSDKTTNTKIKNNEKEVNNLQKVQKQEDNIITQREKKYMEEAEVHNNAINQQILAEQRLKRQMDKSSNFVTANTFKSNGDYIAKFEEEQAKILQTQKALSSTELRTWSKYLDQYKNQYNVKSSLINDPQFIKAKQVADERLRQDILRRSEASKYDYYSYDALSKVGASPILDTSSIDKSNEQAKIVRQRIPMQMFWDSFTQTTNQYTKAGEQAKAASKSTMQPFYKTLFNDMNQYQKAAKQATIVSTPIVTTTNTNNGIFAGIGNRVGSWWNNPKTQQNRSHIWNSWINGGMWGEMKQMSAASNGGKAISGLTGALSGFASFFGPIEAGLIGVQAAMALYDSALKAHQEALAEAANQLEESRSKYDESISNLETSFRESNPNATDEDVENYITEKEAGMYDLTTATMEKGEDAYVDVSHYDANTYALYENTLALRENTQKYLDEQNDRYFGIEGMFTEAWHSILTAFGYDKPNEVTPEQYQEQLEEGDYSSFGVTAGILDSNIKDLEGLTDDAKIIMQIGRSNDEFESSLLYKDQKAILDKQKRTGEEYNEAKALDDLTSEVVNIQDVIGDTFGYDKDSPKRQALADAMGTTTSDRRTNPFSTMSATDARVYQSTIGSMSFAQSQRIGNAMSTYGDEFERLSARAVLRDRQSGRIRQSGESIDPNTGLRTGGKRKGTAVYDEKTHNEIKALANKTDLSYTEVLLGMQLAQMQQMNAIAQNQLLPQIMSQVALHMQGNAALGTGNQINSSTAGSTAATNANAAAIASMMGAEIYKGADEIYQASSGGETLAEGLEKHGYTGRVKAAFESMNTTLNLPNDDDGYKQWLSNLEGGKIDASQFVWSFIKRLSGAAKSQVVDAYNEQLPQLAELGDIGGAGTGSGGGDGSGSGSDDKEESNKKNYVDLVICNKKTIPKLNVNLFKKEPTFKIQNQNLKLRDIKINTQDKPKAISSAVKNAIIDVQERTNPKIIQDQEAEYNPVEATEGTSGTDVPTGTTQTN